jgi:hypothetical protein
MPHLLALPPELLGEIVHALVCDTDIAFAFRVRCTCSKCPFAMQQSLLTLERDVSTRNIR